MKILSAVSFAKKKSIGLIFAMLIACSVSFFSHEAKSFAQQVDDLEPSAAKQKCRKKQKKPLHPKLPRNFTWKGRYIVPDIVDPKTGELGINVPFTWCGIDFFRNSLWLRKLMIFEQIFR